MCLSLGAVLGGLGACSGDEDRADVIGGGMAGSSGGGVTGPCEPGDERECGYKVDQGDGVTTCFQGVQTCGAKGKWSDCEDGQLVQMPDPKPQDYRRRFGSRGLSTLSTETAATCSPADVCDPYCYQVAETGGTFTPGMSDLASELCEPADPLAECTDGPGCAHSLCEEGGALANGGLCGPCSAKVCLVDAFCCLSAWDDSCVALAYELCAYSPPPLSLCDFAVYSLTTFTTSNKPSLGATSRVGSIGDLVIDTDAAGGFPYEVITKGDVWIKNFNTTTASSNGIWASGSLVTNATAVTFTTDVYLGEGAYLASNVKIAGSVYGAGTYGVAIPSAWPSSCGSYSLCGQAGASATKAYLKDPKHTDVSAGTLTQPSTHTAPNIQIPTTIPGPASTSCPGTTSFGMASGTNTRTGSTPTETLTISDGVHSLAPGDYGNVVMTKAAKLVLSSAGSYTFKSLTGSTGVAPINGGIQLGSATGQYQVVVCGKLGLGSNQNIISNTAATTPNDATRAATDTPVMTDPTRLIVYALDADSSGTPAVKFGNDVNFTGVLIVPNGSFENGNYNCTNTTNYGGNCNNTISTFRGSVWAKKFFTDTNFKMVPLTTSQCEGLSIAGTTSSTVGACVLDTGATVSVPAVPPSANDPCRSGLDCQINQRCVDVDSGEGATSCVGWDKCVATNAAVPTSCNEDPCVELVIAASPGCSSNWSSTCTALIPAACDATCSSPTGTRTGVCTDNTGFSGETDCTGYDLALGYPCSNTAIPICNHGSAAVPAGQVISVGYWNINQRKFATASPGTPDGACNVTVPAGGLAAGSCLPLSCAALATTTDYTLMVDPPTAVNVNGVLSECGTAANVGRRLDNWSWFDHTFTCINQPDYAEYEYLADCPDDSYAKWKNLSWVTTNASGSSVVFSAKVAETVADLAAETYTAVDTNTATCSQADADALTAPCSAGLTAALGLTSPQGQALSIRVEKAGTPLPTVTGWEVTYTCEYDQ